MTKPHQHHTSAYARTICALATWQPSARAVATTCAAAATAIATLAGVNVATSHVNVTLEIDGVYRPYSTFATHVDELLSSADIHLGSADHVTPRRNSTVHDGMTITVRTAQPLEIVVNGQKTTLMTTAQSVHDALSALSAQANHGKTIHALPVLSQNDTFTTAASRSGEREALLPLIHTSQNIPITIGQHQITLRLNPGDDIRRRLIEAGVSLSPIDRVKAHVTAGQLSVTVEPVARGPVTQADTIPFTERQIESADFFQGESVVTTPGMNGIQQVTRWQERVAGTIRHSTVLSESAAQAPVEQIRSIGTKPVTPIELVKAGIDPKAQLEDVVETNGTTSKRYRAPLGTLSSDSEIAAIRLEGQLQSIPLEYSGEDPKALARPLVTAHGWDDNEFRCLVALWERESHWNPYAENPSSGAYGIPQSLPGSKMASAGEDWRTNPVTQIQWGLGYIAGRYGTPCGAWGHSESVGWY